MRARVIPANVHDSILMLVNGNCELMFAYHHPELPLHLDPTRYEYLTVGVDTFMPVCKPNQRSAPAFRLPGTNDRPLPLISYTETSYFGRCLAVLLAHADTAPALRLHYESDMAEVVKKLVLEGEGRRVAAAKLHRGRARRWRPGAGRNGQEWQLEVELRVYRDASNHSEFLESPASVTAEISVERALETEM